MPKTTRRRAVGRPRGTDSTRADILAEARTSFADAGYEGTSLRAIAARVGVDPSTIVHFFKSKAGLFRAVIEDAAPAALPLVELLRQEAPGADLVKGYLAIWEDEVSAPSMLALFRTAVASQQAVEILKSALISQALDSVPGEDRLGAELTLTHLAGLALGRHIAKLPELARADTDVLAARVGPVLDAYRSGADRGSRLRPGGK